METPPPRNERAVLSMIEGVARRDQIRARELVHAHGGWVYVEFIFGRIIGLTPTLGDLESCMGSLQASVQDDRVWARSMTPDPALNVAYQHALVDSVPFVAAWIYTTDADSELAGYVRERLEATGCSRELWTVLWHENFDKSLERVCAVLAALA